MDHRDQFFGNLFNESGAGAEEIRIQRQLSFEERIIKRVFNECGAKRAMWGRLVNQCREMTGHHKLNFNWFNATYRQFPGILCGKRIPRLHELTIVDLFKNPDKSNRLAKAIAKNLQRVEIDCARNFIFVFPIVRTMFCAHNLELERGPDMSCVQWRVDLRREGNVPAAATRLIVEPTTTLFRAIGTEWCEAG